MVRGRRRRFRDRRCLEHIAGFRRAQDAPRELEPGRFHEGAVRAAQARRARVSLRPAARRERRRGARVSVRQRGRSRALRSASTRGGDRAVRAGREKHRAVGSNRVPPRRVPAVRRQRRARLARRRPDLRGRARDRRLGRTKRGRFANRPREREARVPVRGAGDQDPRRDAAGVGRARAALGAVLGGAQVLQVPARHHADAARREPDGSRARAALVERRERRGRRPARGSKTDLDGF